MNRIQRLQILKQAQAATAPTAVTPTVPSPPADTTINLRALPNFNSNLFAARPEIIVDINGIVNIINKYLINLTGGKVDFNLVWKNPSLSGAEYSNSTKNLVNLAKWIYNVVRSRAAAYSLDGLKMIATGLIDTVKSYSFPEPNASTAQNDLISAGQRLLARLG